jgi:hypothetical protein
MYYPVLTCPGLAPSSCFVTSYLLRAFYFVVLTGRRPANNGYEAGASPWPMAMGRPAFWQRDRKQPHLRVNRRSRNRAAISFCNTPFLR